MFSDHFFTVHDSANKKFLIMALGRKNAVSGVKGVLVLFVVYSHDFK